MTKIQSVKVCRVFTGESCFMRFTKCLIFLHIKCEMCPSVCSRLPPNHWHFATGSVSSFQPVCCVQNQIKLCASNMTGQGELVPPLYVNSLVLLGAHLSAFISFLFVKEGTETFHYSFFFKFIVVFSSAKSWINFLVNDINTDEEPPLCCNSV